MESSTSMTDLSQPSYTTLLSRNEMPRPSMHSVLLRNGKRVIIYIFFDSSSFSLDRMVDIENLEDLCFIFEPIVCESATKFTFFYNNISGEIVNNGIRNGIRFRVGALLAAAIGETRVLNQTRGVASDEDVEHDHNVLKMNITLKKISPEESALPRFFYSPNHQFLLSCGQRKFELPGIMGTTPAIYVVHPSTEITALHSPSLLSIFYGDSSVPKNNPIRILEIGPLLLQFALSLVAFGKKHRLTLPNSQYSMSLIRFLDQFSFKVASHRLKSSVINRILKHDADIKEDTLEILDYMGDEHIRKKFFYRFTTIECLNGISRKYAGTLSMFNIVQLDKRQNFLHTIMPIRPKVCFMFPEGDIVCSLFTDYYRIPIEKLLWFIRGRLFTRPRLVSLWSVTGKLSLINLSAPLPVQSTNGVNPPLSITPAYWLSYSTQGATRRISLYHGLPMKGLVIGRIDSGSQFLPSVTVLEKVIVM